MCAPNTVDKCSVDNLPAHWLYSVGTTAPAPPPPLCATVHKIEILLAPDVFLVLKCGELCLQAVIHKCVDNIIASNHWTLTIDILPVKFRYSIQA